MRIVADTATLFSPQDGEAMGITVVQAVKNSTVYLILYILYKSKKIKAFESGVTAKAFCFVILRYRYSWSRKFWR